MFGSAMSDLVRLRGFPERIVSGGANGADAMAERWAMDHGVCFQSLSADWVAHGRAAGPIRNQAMIDQFKPSFVIAFPGGRGTADMTSKARDANIDVAEIVASQS